MGVDVGLVVGIGVGIGIGIVLYPVIIGFFEVLRDVLVVDGLIARICRSKCRACFVGVVRQSLEGRL